MKKYIVLLVCVLCYHANAQNNLHLPQKNSYSIGISAGVMNAKTDLGRDINLPATKLNAGVFSETSFNHAFTGRVALNFGEVESKDAYMPLDASMKKLRNLSFRSKIIEAISLVEWHPLNYKTAAGSQRKFSPYVTAGIGVFHFDPETYFEDKSGGSWVRLQPLHIDGQGFTEYPDRKNYQLTQLNFPFGAGLKFNANKQFSFRFEMLHRFLKTDYLDDVSEAKTDISLYSKYLSVDDAALAQQLYIRRGEIEPGNNLQTGPRGNKGKDGYFSLNFLFAYKLR